MAIGPGFVETRYQPANPYDPNSLRHTCCRLTHVRVLRVQEEGLLQLRHGCKACRMLQPQVIRLIQSRRAVCGFAPQAALHFYARTRPQLLPAHDAPTACLSHF